MLGAMAYITGQGYRPTCDKKITHYKLNRLHYYSKIATKHGHEIFSLSFKRMPAYRASPGPLMNLSGRFVVGSEKREGKRKEKKGTG